MKNKQHGITQHFEEVPAITKTDNLELSTDKDAIGIRKG